MDESADPSNGTGKDELDDSSPPKKSRPSSEAEPENPSTSSGSARSPKSDPSAVPKANDEEPRNEGEPSADNASAPASDPAGVRSSSVTARSRSPYRSRQDTLQFLIRDVLDQHMENEESEGLEESDDDSVQHNAGPLSPSATSSCSDSSSTMSSETDTTSTPSSRSSSSESPYARSSSTSPDRNQAPAVATTVAGAPKGRNFVKDLEERQRSGVAFRATEANRSYSARLFERRIYSSLYVAKHLTLSHRLRGHRGCVNSLNFNTDGTLLASGSDDLRLKLWQWPTGKLLHTVQTGHRQNVFQTKFVDNGCKMRQNLDVLTTGRDGQVRYVRIDNSGKDEVEVLFKCSRPIHKIAIPVNTPNSFVTAGEDGKVRMCDLRQGKMETLLDVSFRLYSVATHPLDSQFCITGNDVCVSVYDFRNVREPLKKLRGLRKKKSHASITSAVYNHIGTEIVASYSDENVYLFDNTVNGQLVKPISSFKDHRNINTIKGISFFGQQSEYIVSGSDCGYTFVWDKKSQTVVNWLRSGPLDVVNCIEPHPEFPIVATSGLSRHVMVWAPKGLIDGQTLPRSKPSDRERQRHFRQSMSPGWTGDMLMEAFNIPPSEESDSDSMRSYDMSYNSEYDGMSPTHPIFQCNPS
ncbi:DDB1- and CUL4-associated factor 8-like [Anopheles albimanus]|uniref:DDB1- and CUL4-associated factor 8-like n=1 Tax=Anopheles albimanus TaxID=7167 RepID=UPI00163F226D|nr:DDB1- and CUL4-associated factor 8-like [Anopheles albimanus]